MPRARPQRTVPHVAQASQVHETHCGRDYVLRAQSRSAQRRHVSRHGQDRRLVLDVPQETVPAQQHELHGLPHGNREDETRHDGAKQPRGARTSRIRNGTVPRTASGRERYISIPHAAPSR